MRAGNLDRKISIERKADGKDAFGGDAGDWEKVADAWASFKPMRDTDRLQAGRIEVKAAGWFTVRWGAALAHLDGVHSILMDGGRWEIIGFKEIGRRRWIEFTAVWVD